MGSFGGIDLAFADAAVQAGVGLRLDKPAKVDFELMTSNGSNVRLCQDRETVVAYLPDAAKDAETAYRVGYDAIQEALDILAVARAYFVSTPNGHRSHLSWWREAGTGIIARLTDCVPNALRLEVSWEKRDKSGEVVARSEDEPLPEWIEAMRYLRYSQIGEDLYNSYRTAYLALESLLSVYFPRTGGEGDKAWNLRACREMQQRGFDFSPVVDGDGADKAKVFVDEQYVAHRCAQDHAKVTDAHYLPAVLDDRPLVMNALTHLTTFVLAALRDLAGAGSWVGGTTYAGMEMFYEAIRGMQLAVSPDQTPVDDADIQASPQGMPVSTLATTCEGPVDGVGYDYGWLGELATEQLADPLICTTAGVVGNGTLMTRGNVPPLDLSGSSRFEYRQIHYWSANSGMRRDFEL